jgi:Leucine-rich repeat (LRR) protein
MKTMRYLVAVTSCFLSFNLLGQLTMIPDANFEQALIDLGYDNGVINGSVNTDLINTVTHLVVDFLDITDLTGIEDFTALTYLECQENHLTSLDLSGNPALTYLACSDNHLTNLNLNQNSSLTDLEGYNNQLTDLDLSENSALTYLSLGLNHLVSLDLSVNSALTFLNCIGNQLLSLDVSQNTALTYLDFSFNQLTSLDVSQNTALTVLAGSSNQLTSLDLRNGNNTFLQHIHFLGNLNLTCINVDDVQFSLNDWTGDNFTFDTQHYFSMNCLFTNIEVYNPIKELIRVTNILGGEVYHTTNQVLFYIYDDGSVEKKFVAD